MMLNYLNIMNYDGNNCLLFRWSHNNSIYCFYNCIFIIAWACMQEKQFDEINKEIEEIKKSK